MDYLSGFFDIVTNLQILFVSKYSLLICTINNVIICKSLNKIVTLQNQTNTYARRRLIKN